MPKLYEIFKILQIQTRIVSAETIQANTVFKFNTYVDIGSTNKNRLTTMILAIFSIFSSLFNREANEFLACA